MKKKILIISAVSIMILLAIGVLYYFNNTMKSTPQETLLTFEESINTNDINGMIDCLIPELQDEADELIKKTDDYIEKPVTLLIEAMPFLSGILDIDVLPGVKFNYLKEEISEETAIIKIKVLIEEKKISIKANVNMIKIKRRWYIKSIKPVLF